MDDSVTTIDRRLLATTPTGRLGNVNVDGIINSSGVHDDPLVSAYPSSILRRRYHHRQFSSMTSTRTDGHGMASSELHGRSTDVKRPIRFHVPSSVPSSLGLPSLASSSSEMPSLSRSSTHLSSLVVRPRPRPRTRIHSRSRSQSPRVKPHALSLRRCPSSPPAVRKPIRTNSSTMTRKLSTAKSPKPDHPGHCNITSAYSIADGHGNRNGGDSDSGGVSASNAMRRSSARIRRSATTHAGIMSNRQRNRRTRIKRTTSDRTIPVPRSRHSHRTSLDPSLSSSLITTTATSSTLIGHRSSDANISNETTTGVSPHASLSVNGDAVRRACPSRPTRRWAQDYRSQPVARPPEGELDGVFRFLQSCKNAVFNFFRGIPAFFSGISRIAASFIRGFTPAIHRSSPLPS